MHARDPQAPGRPGWQMPRGLVRDAGCCFRVTLQGNELAFNVDRGVAVYADDALKSRAIRARTSLRNSGDKSDERWRRRAGSGALTYGLSAKKCSD
jgi:hypothetical protein